MGHSAFSSSLGFAPEPWSAGACIRQLIPVAPASRARCEVGSRRTQGQPVQ